MHRSIQLTRKKVDHINKMIATCFAGELRTFRRPDVREHIFMSLHGIRKRMDTFVAIRTSMAAPKVTHLFAPLKPVALVIRPMNDTLGVLRSHTLCWSRIVKHESLRGREYVFVMRMRTDIIYVNLAEFLVQFFERRRDANVIYVEACGATKKKLPTGQVNCPRLVPASSATASVLVGCAKDTWAIMPRRAAGAYFDPLTFARFKRKLCSGRNMECLLGCAVYQRDAMVRFRPVDIKRKIIRASSKIGLGLDICNTRGIRPLGTLFA